MSHLPAAVAKELEKQEAAERRKAREEHATAQLKETPRLRHEVEAEHSSKSVHAHLAIARNAVADSEQLTLIVAQPDSEAAEFNYATDASSLWLSFYHMPPRLRGFVDAVCGLAGAREQWFEATDVRIGKRMGRSTKTVQRDRDDLDAWQRENEVTFIEIEDHVTDSKGRRHAHKYKVHLPRLAVKAKRDAQASHRWMSDPAKALEQAVKANLKDAPGALPRKPHRRQLPSLEKTIESDIRRAANLILKSAKNLQKAEIIRLTKGYMLSVGIKPELLAALEHSLQVLKKEAEPDAEILAPLDAFRIHTEKDDGQNVRKETIHSDDLEAVVVSKDLPTDAPLSEYLKVPSIAREVRRAQQEGARCR